MSKKVALVAFNGEAMCFVHVMLNAMDMKEKGYQTLVIIEGSATKLVQELNDTDHAFSGMYKKFRDQGLIDCVCKACAIKMGAKESAMEQNLPLKGDMLGHPSLEEYMTQGYEIITF